MILSEKRAIHKVPDQPVVHTIFRSTSPIEDTVIQVWKDEWIRAGFDPLVLSLDDAKKHYDFDDEDK